MSNWGESMTDRSNLTFGELGELFDGPHATPKREDTGPYFLNISSLIDGRLDLSQSDHVSGEEFALWTRRVTPQEGDLLFSYETRLGDAALMPPDVVACLGRRMALIRPDRDIIDPAFFLYFYISPGFKELIEKHTIHGATVNRIGLSTMGKWPVSIPSLPDQRAIAEVLGALDNKIEANTALTHLADELCAAHTRRALNSLAPQSLSSIAILTMGSSPAGASFNEEGHGRIFYQGVRDFGVRFPKRRIWTTSPVRFADANDVLLSVRAPVGQVNFSSERTCIGRGLASVRSRDGRPNTLFHLLRAAPEIWEPYEAEGTIFGSINKAQLEAIEVPSIAVAVAEELESRLAAIEARIASALAESESLAATRDALLPALMSGKLRVSDAEKVLEGVL